MTIAAARPKVSPRTATGGAPASPRLALILVRLTLAPQNHASRSGDLAVALPAARLSSECSWNSFAREFATGCERFLPGLAGFLAGALFCDDSASSRPGTVTWSRRACTFCDGTRYLIVVSSDLCPYGQNIRPGASASAYDGSS